MRHDRYDLVVIGGGTAGLVAAAGAAGVGARVALVERERLGGDCLNTGCVPSKTLLASAALAAAIRRAPSFGLDTPPPLVNFAAVMARVREARATLAPHDGARRLQERGVDVLFGQARFVAADAIEVDGARVAFGRAVIATGGRPIAPDVEGLDTARVFTSETIFELRDAPSRLAVLGGGPVGCELAQAFARLGTSVYLLEAAPRLLPREDPDAADLVRTSLVHDGVTVLTGTRAHHAVSTGGVQLTIARGAIAETLQVDAVLAAIGRRPNTSGLDPGAAGVAVERTGRVIVDDYLRTTNRRVYAAGDVCLPWQFTHAADASARLAVRNALFAGRGRASRLLVPRVTYTDPEVAAAGLTLETAAEHGIRVRAFTVPYAEVDRAVTEGATSGFARLLIGSRHDRIVGATVAGARAGEVMAEVTLAMSEGIGLARLAAVVRAYPTYASALSRAADAYNRTRVTPGVSRLLGAWLAVRRRLPGT